MRRWTTLYLFITLTLTLAGIVPRAVADDNPATKEAWIATLGKMTFQAHDYQMLQKFVQSDSELVYTTLRDGWGQIENVTIRQYLVQLLVNGTGLRYVNGVLMDSATLNPHLLDILALGLADPAPQVKATASQFLGGIVFRDIKTPDDLRDWRKAAGDRPLGELVDNACRAAVHSLELAQGVEKANTLRRLLTIQFYSGRYSSSVNGITTSGISATGLTARRRQAAVGAGLFDTLAHSLKPESPPIIRELAVKLIAHFAPDDDVLVKLEPDLKREVPAVLERADANEVYDLLSQIKARWVTDLLLQRLTQGDPTRTNLSWAVASVLGNSGDARAIPGLIALYDTASPPDFLGQVIERSLTQLTKLPYQFNSDHDGDWWRDWWQEHKSQFPEEARNMPYPRIMGVHRMENFSLRRHAERRSVGAGRMRDYWLISPGVVTVPSEQAHPGLMVVLSDQPYAPPLVKAWEETAGQAWDGQYLVAYVARPPSKPLSGPADIPVLELVNDAVKDAQSRASIDPRRVFLCGEGDAGLAAYACSLEKSTPFHGFLLLSSPFRSAQLPSLAMAKGRRYYLLHDKSDKTAPYFLAEAAQSMLKKQGASVLLTTLDSTKDNRANAATRNTALHQAVQWLETAR